MRALWASHGDCISRGYAGTGALRKTDFVRDAAISLRRRGGGPRTITIPHPSSLCVTQSFNFHCLTALSVRSRTVVPWDRSDSACTLLSERARTFP